MGYWPLAIDMLSTYWGARLDTRNRPRGVTGTRQLPPAVGMQKLDLAVYASCGSHLGEPSGGKWMAAGQTPSKPVGVRLRPGVYPFSTTLVPYVSRGVEGGCSIGFPPFSLN